MNEGEKMWWWIEPLFYTGMVGFCISGIISIIFHDCESDIVAYIALALLTPLLLSIVSVVIWFLWWVLYSIWAPYF